MNYAINNIHKKLDNVHTETTTSDFTFDFHVHVQKNLGFSRICLQCHSVFAGSFF